ncbi:MAG: hypothetical protein G5663_06100 [Serratia symbiotica]|nr:hypothetical protein [Serratia symbiotica]
MAWLSKSSRSPTRRITTTPLSLGVHSLYSMAMIRVLMLKRIFGLTLRALQGFVDSIFTLIKVPLKYLDYTCISKQAQSVNLPFKTPTPGLIAHLVIKHGQGKQQTWRKLYLTVDTEIHHEVICADLSLSNITDTEALTGLIRQTVP